LDLLLKIIINHFFNIYFLLYIVNCFYENNQELAQNIVDFISYFYDGNFDFIKFGKKLNSLLSSIDNKTFKKNL